MIITAMRIPVPLLIAPGRSTATGGEAKDSTAESSRSGNDVLELLVH